MDEVILRKTFSISGADLKREFAKDREMKADRKGSIGAISYLAHADGYVMCRLGEGHPIVLSMDEWSALPPA